LGFGNTLGMLLKEAMINKRNPYYSNRKHNCSGYDILNKNKPAEEDWVCQTNISQLHPKKK